MKIKDDGRDTVICCPRCRKIYGCRENRVYSLCEFSCNKKKHCNAHLIGFTTYPFPCRDCYEDMQ